MVKVINIGSFNYYRPPEWKGLEELIRFPDGEFKRESIPNSTIWVFNKKNHQYIPAIFADDVGCGIAMFVIKKVDHKEAADKIYEYLKEKNVLGRGNHFVDICTSINSECNTLLVHSDGKSYDRSIPKSVEEAILKQQVSEKFREELGQELIELIGTRGELAGNWTHNLIEENEKVIYRKGCIKVEPEKTYILPAHLGAKILIYTVDKSTMPPYFSMPHATGRSGPRGKMKVAIKEAAEVRNMVYIPEGISNSALRTEHPKCYNDFTNIIDTLGKSAYIKPIDEIQILSYIGKV